MTKYNQFHISFNCLTQKKLVVSKSELTTIKYRITCTSSPSTSNFYLSPELILIVMKTPIKQLFEIWKMTEGLVYI